MMRVNREYIEARGGVAAVLALKRTLLVVTAFLVIIIGSVMTLQADADDGQPLDGQRVITLHDRGLEQSFVTDATTVGDALKGASIELDNRDRVEPGLDESLVANEYTINVYRARPLLIVDGQLRQIVMTAAQVPEQIAKDAGITLRDEDITVLERSDNLLHDRAAERLVITRAIPFEFTLYGETFTAYTQATTVGELLKEKSVKLTKNDRVSLALDERVMEGMKLRVWREGKQTITTDEDIKFEVEKIQDADRSIGYRQVKTPGVKGERTVTYEITIKDGKESSRKEISSVTKKKSQKQIEIVGVKPQTMSYTGGGSKTEWLAASAIPESQWGYADMLVQKESGWNPNAVNSSSGACGLGQQLPCGKWSGAWNDPVVGLNGMHGYVMGRYGSWQAAVEHSRAKGWY